MEYKCCPGCGCEDYKWRYYKRRYVCDSCCAEFREPEVKYKCPECGCDSYSKDNWESTVATCDECGTEFYVPSKVEVEIW